MTRLVRSRVPAATVILLGIFPRTWDGGDYKGRKYAKDVWPNPLSQVLCWFQKLLLIKMFVMFIIQYLSTVSFSASAARHVRGP